MKKVQTTLQKLKMVPLFYYAGILLVVLGLLAWIDWSRIKPTTTERHQEIVNHFVTVSEVNEEKEIYYEGMRWIFPDSTSRFFDIANFRKSEPGISSDISRRLFYLQSSDEFLDVTLTKRTDYAKKAEKTRKFWMAFVFSVMGLCLLCCGTFKSKHS